MKPLFDFMPTAPFISVLMTSYNRQKYIVEAIESVLASTYSNFELIIVDDRSTDNTYAIAKEYEKKDSRVRVYRNEKNLGDYPNRNQAASYAKGKYLKYLDSDDTIYPDGLEYCVTQMERFPNASIGLVTFKKINGDSAIAISGREAIKNHFFEESSLHIGPTGCIIKTECFEKNEGFDTRFKVASDNYFNIQMAMMGDVVFMPYQYFYYRQHEGQEINNSTSYLINNFLFNRELFRGHYLPLTDKQITFLNKKLQKRHSVNLVIFFFKTKNIGKVVAVMQSTNYSLLNFLKGFFY